MTIHFNSPWHVRSLDVDIPHPSNQCCRIPSKMVDEWKKLKGSNFSTQILLPEQDAPLPPRVKSHLAPKNPRNVNVNLNVPWWKRITWYDVYVIKYIYIITCICINMYTNQIWYTIKLTHTLFEFFPSTPFGFRSAAWFTAGHLLRDDSLGPPGPRPWPTDGLVEAGGWDLQWTPDFNKCCPDIVKIPV